MTVIVPLRVWHWRTAIGAEGRPHRAGREGPGAFTIRGEPMDGNDGLLLPYQSTERGFRPCHLVVTDTDWQNAARGFALCVQLGVGVALRGDWPLAALIAWVLFRHSC